VTEAEWDACADPEAMLRLLRGRVSDRKLRLFAVACCRRVAHINTHPGAAPAVEAAERFADGRIGERERLQAWRGVYAKQYGDLTTWSAALGAVKKQAFPAARHASSRAAYDVAAGLSGDSWRQAWEAERRAQAGLLRCIAGNPFRPVAPEPGWLTSTAAGLASGIYAERAFDLLPVLADALQDAGCGDADVLAHCRGPGPHVRGCWVVDLVLARE
jgi:hypothetical protein